MNIGDVFVSVKAEVGREFQGAIERDTVAAADRAGAKGGKALGDQLAQNAARAAKVGLGALGLALGFATKGTLELETATAKFRAETGATAEEAQRAGKAINEMSGSNLQGIEEIGRTLSKVHTDLGLTGDAAEAATQDFLDYGTATGRDAAEGVSALDDVLDAWNLDASKSKGIMDQLIASHQKYGGSIAADEAALKDLAPALQAANMSFDDGIGLLNQFKVAGIDAAAAPAAMTKALAKVKSPDELKALIEDIRATEDPFLRAQKAADLFGTKAGPKMANALRPGTESLEQLTITADEAAGATTDAAGAIESTLGNQVKLALKQLGATAIDVLGKGGPLLTGLASAGSLAGSLGLGGGLQKIKDLILRMLPGAVAASTAVGTASGVAQGEAQAAAASNPGIVARFIGGIKGLLAHLLPTAVATGTALGTAQGQAQATAAARTAGTATAATGATGALGNLTKAIGGVALAGAWWEIQQGKVNAVNDKSIQLIQAHTEKLWGAEESAKFWALAQERATAEGKSLYDTLVMLGPVAGDLTGKQINMAGVVDALGLTYRNGAFAVADWSDSHDRAKTVLAGTAPVVTATAASTQTGTANMVASLAALSAAYSNQSPLQTWSTNTITLFGTTATQVRASTSDIVQAIIGMSSPADQAWQTFQGALETGTIDQRLKLLRERFAGIPKDLSNMTPSAQAAAIDAKQKISAEIYALKNNVAEYSKSTGLALPDALNSHRTITGNAAAQTREAVRTKMIALGIDATTAAKIASKAVPKEYQSQVGAAIAGANSHEQAVTRAAAQIEKEAVAAARAAAKANPTEFRKQLGPAGTAAFNMASKLNDPFSPAWWAAFERYGASASGAVVRGFASNTWSAGQASAQIANALRKNLQFSAPPPGPLNTVDQWMPHMIDRMVASGRRSLHELVGFSGEMARALVPPTLTPSFAAADIGALTGSMAPLSVASRSTMTIRHEHDFTPRTVAAFRENGYDAGYIAELLDQAESSANLQWND